MTNIVELDFVKKLQSLNQQIKAAEKWAEIPHKISRGNFDFAVCKLSGEGKDKSRHWATDELNKRIFLRLHVDLSEHVKTALNDMRRERDELIEKAQDQISRMSED